MELRHIRTFLAVAEAHSFLGAEEQLFISRQAISKIIAQLEEELGVTLFLRSQSGTVLTPAGIYFYNRASALAAGFDNMVEEMHNIGRTYRPRIRICIALGLHSLYADRLRTYALEHSHELELEISGRLEKGSEAVLTDRRADALVSFEPIDTHMTCSSVLKESPLILLANRKDKRSPEEMMAGTRLLYTGGGDTCLWLTENTQKNDILSGEFAYLFSELKRGTGVMLLPRALVPNYLDFAYEAAAADLPAAKTWYTTLNPSYYDSLTYGLLEKIRTEALGESL